MLCQYVASHFAFDLTLQCEKHGEQDCSLISIIVHVALAIDIVFLHVKSDGSPVAIRPIAYFS